MNALVSATFLLAMPLLACAHPDCAVAQEAGQPFILEATIPLNEVSGRIDHLAVDLARRRLFIAELGNNTADVIDLDTRQPIYRISELKEPQGVAYVAATDTVVIANAKDGSVVFFSGADFAPLGKLDLGADADNIRVMGDTGHIVVGYGAGALAVIDSRSRAKIANIRLAAHPESFQLSRDGARGYVNVPDAKHVAAVDLRSGNQIAVWPVSNFHSNFPMAIDGSDTTLAVAFRSPARLVLIDTGNGATKTQLETCGDADDIFFDSRRNRIYVSCGEGVVDVLEQVGSSLRRLARITSGAGARTSLFVPELDRLYVAVRAGTLWGKAAILVFRPEP